MRPAATIVPDRVERLADALAPDLGHAVPMAEVDRVLRREFQDLFGTTVNAIAPGRDHHRHAQVVRLHQRHRRRAARLESVPAIAET